jgi:hypothetical protein
MNSQTVFCSDTNNAPNLDNGKINLMTSVVFIYLKLSFVKVIRYQSGFTYGGRLPYIHYFRHKQAPE